MLFLQRILIVIRRVTAPFLSRKTRNWGNIYFLNISWNRYRNSRKGAADWLKNLRTLLDGSVKFLENHVMLQINISVVFTINVVQMSLFIETPWRALETLC